VNCPFCEHGETKVVDSRVAGRGAIRRRRECLVCSQRFTTFERTEEALTVLRDLDRVAYVRFASVYRDFQSVAEFERELARLEGRKRHTNGTKRKAQRTPVR